MRRDRLAGHGGGALLVADDITDVVGPRVSFDLQPGGPAIRVTLLPGRVTGSSDWEWSATVQVECWAEDQGQAADLAALLRSVWPCSTGRKLRRLGYVSGTWLRIGAVLVAGPGHAPTPLCADARAGLPVGSRHLIVRDPRNGVVPQVRRLLNDAAHDIADIARRNAMAHYPASQLPQAIAALNGTDADGAYADVGYTNTTPVRALVVRSRHIEDVAAPTPAGGANPGPRLADTSEWKEPTHERGQR